MLNVHLLNVNALSFYKNQQMQQLWRGYKHAGMLSMNWRDILVSVLYLLHYDMCVHEH